MAVVVMEFVRLVLLNDNVLYEQTFWSTRPVKKVVLCRVLFDLTAASIRNYH
jgi:hypothetical protein